MRTLTALIFMALCSAAYSQGIQVAGEIVDEKNLPLPSATTVLLDPADSTMLYFAITGNDGRFVIKNIKSGNYLFQASLIGYTTMYRSLTLPSATESGMGIIIMPVKVYGMGEVTVTGERIPMKIKQDTIEYDAKAFKVKPDGVAEDLIKKLPGVEVDRSGNIKVMGEDVSKVLVDGKEFFSSDATIATRNLPADAIATVQFFDKQSDESSFTGIDDGQRDPTLNFILEKDKKKGMFGEASVGGGTGAHYAASAKLYRFTQKTQMAALGMMNNINQYGFSMRDYINTGEGGSSAGGGSFPSNFGQQVTGTGSNGAAGLNFSLFNDKKDRLFASYLGKGSKRNLIESSLTKNYIPDGTYLTDGTSEQVKRDTSHSLNFGLRKTIGERQNIIINGTASYSSASNPLTSLTENSLNDVVLNSLERRTGELKKGLSFSLDASYLVKFNSGKTFLRLSGKSGYSGSDSNSEFLNRTEYFDPYESSISNQFYNVKTGNANYSGGLSVTHKISYLSFIDFSVDGGYSTDNLKRRQGDISDDETPDDQLSPDFTKTDRYFKPGISWKRSTTKSKITLSLSTTIGEYLTSLNNDEEQVSEYFFLTPRARWELDYKSGRRLMLDFSSSVSTPQSSQLLPVVNNVNSLSLYYGNRDLKPEYSHNIRASWWLFDQFSFTSLLSAINIRYTKDKIGYSRMVDTNLGQTATPVNVEDDWSATGNVSFSTPVKPLGIKINLSVSGGYNRGISFINETENICSSFTHKYSLTIDNRKKDKWDIKTGGVFSLTQSDYSVQSSLNNTYHDISWFGEVRFSPDDRFSFNASSDITNYSARGFDEARLVPLVGAGMSYYFLSTRKASFTLSGSDLLNRDTGIERASEMNYIVEKNSNVIGRYIMLTFRYRPGSDNATGNGGMHFR